MFTLSHHA